MTEIVGLILLFLGLGPYQVYIMVSRRSMAKPLTQVSKQLSILGNAIITLTELDC